MKIKRFNKEVFKQQVRENAKLMFRKNVEEISKEQMFQAVALTVKEEVTCGEMISEIGRACKQVTDVELFDIYRGAQIGAGQKSMAFKIRFESDEHALQPEEVDKYIKKILGNLKFKLGAEIR